MALDIIVASVHSKLRSPGEVMTKRMLEAMEDPNIWTSWDIAPVAASLSAVDVRHLRSTMQPSLPHAETTRSQSRSTLDRSAKTRRAICCELAGDTRWWVSIDTDAHAPGQLEVAMRRLRPRRRVWCHRRPA